MRFSSLNLRGGSACAFGALGGCVRAPDVQVQDEAFEGDVAHERAPWRRVWSLGFGVYGVGGGGWKFCCGGKGLG